VAKSPSLSGWIAAPGDRAANEIESKREIHIVTRLPGLAMNTLAFCMNVVEAITREPRGVPAPVSLDDLEICETDQDHSPRLLDLKSRDEVGTKLVFQCSRTGVDDVALAGGNYDEASAIRMTKSRREWPPATLKISDPRIAIGGNYPNDEAFPVSPLTRSTERDRQVRDLQAIDASSRTHCERDSDDQSVS